MEIIYTFSTILKYERFRKPNEQSQVYLNFAMARNRTFKNQRLFPQVTFAQRQDKAGMLFMEKAFIVRFVS